MATVIPTLDTRRETQKGYPVKLKILHKNRTAFISLDIYIHPDQWDGNKVIRHPKAAMHNKQIIAKLAGVQAGIDNAGRRAAKMTVTELRDWALAIANGEDPNRKESALFWEVFEEFTQTRDAKRTKEIYRTTMNRIAAYDKGHLRLEFEDITPRWLNGFDAFLAETSPSVNARNIHMRNIRAVFNYALDNELTTCYPFRRYKLRYEETEKRAVTAEELRRLFSVDTCGFKESRDMLQLIFLLIGINVTDLYNLKPSDYYDGRIHYRRAKTHRLYSIKVEPEAEAIIEKWRGEEHLLHFADYYADAHTALQALNKFCKRTGTVQADITTYVLRHTWATIAYNDLRIPKDTISLALGHSSGNRVTSVYIKPDLRLVDEANRRVIDFVMRANARPGGRAVRCKVLYRIALRRKRLV